MTMTPKSHTITMEVNKKTGEVFNAILHIPPKMVPDAKQISDGSWKFTSPLTGIPGKLKFNENEDLGILDYHYVDDEAEWNVPMRVVPHGEKSSVIITLFKPIHFTDEKFEQRMKEIEQMFQQMKLIIETN